MDGYGTGGEINGAPTAAYREERQLVFGVPGDPDALARHYIFTRSDQDLVLGRRGAANRLGFAVQLALLRHPSISLAQIEEPPDALVEWLAAPLDIPPTAFADYANRPQTHDGPYAPPCQNAWLAAAEPR